MLTFAMYFSFAAENFKALNSHQIKYSIKIDKLSWLLKSTFRD